MLLTIACAVLAVIAIAVAHEAGQLAIGRALGLRARIHPSFPALVEVHGVHVAGDISRGRRALVIGGGFAAAYAALAVLAFAYHAIHGLPAGSGIVVDGVVAGYDADGKLAPGDRIVAVDHAPLDADTSPSLAERVNHKAGAPIELDILRDGSPRTVTVAPKRNGERWLLGIKPTPVIDYRTDIAASAVLGLRYPIDQVTAIAQHAYTAVGGSERADPGGPMRMVEEYRSAAPGPMRSALLDGAYILLVLAGFDLVRLFARPRR